MKTGEVFYHLHIGDLIVTPETAVISTVVGSCVAVCLFLNGTHVGGMIHYAHPRADGDKAKKDDYRYGDQALPALVEELERMTGRPRREFCAKLAGGVGPIGAENVKYAKEYLSENQIPIVGESVGGDVGRKVVFHTVGGRLRVAKIGSGEGRVGRPSPAPSLSQKRKVLVVDDSKTIRDLLKRVLSEDPDLEIIGFAADAFEAAQLVAKERPDVITLDVHMPGMTGVEWLEKLLPVNPIPVVMITSLQLQDGNEVFRALELGAVDYIQKPTLAQLPVIGSVIREKVKGASYAKVVGSSARIKPYIETGAGTDLDLRKVLVIGASTGGTEAIKSVMCRLPEKIPPTVIVQHIPPVFSKAFADRLNTLCPFEVKEAEDGDEVCPSRVLIAPGGKQMKIERGSRGLCVRITDDPPVSRHKPSVDYLFSSAARVLGSQCVGVILTGMGADGANGMLEMRKAGAKTIGQDEESCVVYGMPRAAYEIGAVEKVCSLDQMPQEILTAFKHRKAA